MLFWLSFSCLFFTLLYWWWVQEGIVFSSKLLWIHSHIPPSPVWALTGAPCTVLQGLECKSHTHESFFFFNLILLWKLKTKNRICRKYTIEPSFREAEQILYYIQLNNMLKMVIGRKGTASISFPILVSEKLLSW